MGSVPKIARSYSHLWRVLVLNNVNRLLYLNLIEKKEPVKRYRGVTVDVFFFSS